MFFVLHPNSRNWSVLKKEGFRLVAFGSKQHNALLRNASLVVSSHIDVDMISPIPEREYDAGIRPWRFVFLQHGVTKDDISLWLSRKVLDLLVTSTQPETASFIEDETPYRFTTREVKLLGMARYDRLLELAAREGEKRFITVAPTWRNGLMKSDKDDEGRREVVDDFWESSYAVNWLSFLQSRELEQIASVYDCVVKFFPHPNFSKVFEKRDFGAHVELAQYESVAFQSVVSRSKVLVTDFSSVGFDAAVADVPVIYFQFDDARSGGHIMTEGYFDYVRDGFGPVVRTNADLLSATSQICSGAWADEELYAERRSRTFSFERGSSCRSTLSAIDNLFERVKDV